MAHIRSTDKASWSQDEGSIEGMLQALHCYSQTLKGTKSLSQSFQTPMQKAISFSKQLASIHITHMQDSEIERLYRLLPLGVQTHLSVDIYELLGKGKMLQLRVNVPLTLMITEGNATLVGEGEGRIRVTHYQRIHEALKAFQREIRVRSAVNSAGFPAFVYRNSQQRTAFYMNLRELITAYSDSIQSTQVFQQYIQPPSTSISILKAHWKNMRKRTSYYIITKKQGSVHSINPRNVGKIPCLMRQLSDPSCNFVEERDRFSVSATSFANCWAVKRLNPLPEVDQMMLEVSRLIETQFLANGQRVEEVVCDFMQNKERKWVLLQCCGCVYSRKSRSIGRIQSSCKPNLKFLALPELSHSSSFILQNHSIKKSDSLSIPLKSVERRFSMSFDQTLTLAADSTSASIHFPLRSQSLAPYEAAAKLRDEVIGNVRRIKSELKGSIDLLNRYGGVNAWAKGIERLQKHLVSKTSNGSFSDGLNMEEGIMMGNAYLRVLTGGYGQNYQQAVKLIHQNKGIKPADFDAFMAGVEELLMGQELASQDCDLALARFKSFRPFILSLDS
jgi:hypothetical protein